MVMSGTGQAEFVTKYRAIVFKPFKGEVVDGVVNNVNKVRSTACTSTSKCAHIPFCSLDGLLCGCGAIDCIRVTSGERGDIWTGTPHGSAPLLVVLFTSTCIHTTGCYPCDTLFCIQAIYDCQEAKW